MNKIRKPDIAKSIQAGVSQSVIVDLVQQHINDFNLNVTTQQWLLKHYKDLRRWANPDPSDMIFSLIKRLSDIPALEAEGRAELAIFNQKILDIKQRFPK